VHDHKNCVVTQRDVGVDTEHGSRRSKNALRQAPDVILIGEIRDRQTMEYAIEFSETGHLCMATLHANSSNQALDRHRQLLPRERRQQLLMDLSLNIRAFIAQRLLPQKAEGTRRRGRDHAQHAAHLDLIFKGEVHEIKQIMAKSRELGMQTFDQHLFELYEAGRSATRTRCATPTR
jgi:twitching motility protein PilU